MLFIDSSKEKHIRGLLKSEVIKVLSSKNLVILDGLNYIKGYRYELYCATKANVSTQCTICVTINQDKAWEFNLKQINQYSRSIFDALIMRYEDPDPKNRWDSPLFYSYLDKELDLKAVSDCLFLKKPPPKNMATENVRI